jgi:hypothetical protein
MNRTWLCAACITLSSLFTSTLHASPCILTSLRLSHFYQFHCVTVLTSRGILQCVCSPADGTLNLMLHIYKEGKPANWTRSFWLVLALPTMCAAETDFTLSEGCRGAGKWHPASFESRDHLRRDRVTSDFSHCITASRQTLQTGLTRCVQPYVYKVSVARALDSCIYRGSRRDDAKKIASASKGRA